MVGRVPFSRHHDRKAIQKNMQKKLIWLVVWNIFIFTPSWGKGSNLTTIFQRGYKPPTSDVLLQRAFDIQHIQLNAFG